MSALTELSLKEMQVGLREGRFSSRELVEAALKRILQLEPSLHAFLYLASELALRQADEADKRRTMNNKRKMPLAGIPVAVKDVLTVEGMPATAGSKIIEGFMPPYTATAVKKLQEAGAIVIGKTNTDEFAMGSSTENSAYGVRLFGRIGSCGSRPTCPSGAGNGYGRLGTTTGFVLRRDGAEAYLRPCITLRPDCLRLIAGLRRRVRTQC
jgi:aspartyl-tRNA(Asn)/glutamyl-tRNA(Gln) amidotransferase subunit A